METIQTVSSWVDWWFRVVLENFLFSKVSFWKAPLPPFSLKLDLTVTSLLLGALHNGRRQYQSSVIFILSFELLFFEGWCVTLFTRPHDFGFLAKTAIYACPNMTKARYCISWLTVREWPGHHSQFFRWFFLGQRLACPRCPMCWRW